MHFAALRAENANMFTLMEENAALREQVETLRLQLECCTSPTRGGDAPTAGAA